MKHSRGRPFGNCRLARIGAVVSILAVFAGGLAGCGSANLPSPTALQPRGASVAFDSIDGPPPAQFRTLVRALNDEAQVRHLAVISREDASAYRVRGYLTAKAETGQTTITWLWDVFDRDGHRALRINGKETAKDPGGHGAWSAADDAMLRRVARASMEQLAAFLTSPNTGPDADAAIALSGASPETPRVQPIGLSDSSPEANGIYRIFQAHADPALQDDPNPLDGPNDSGTAPSGTGAQVPLPPRRPDDRAAGAAAVELASADR